MSELIKNKHHLVVGLMLLASFSCSLFSWYCQKKYAEELSRAYALSREEFEFLAAVPPYSGESLSDALREAKIPHYFHGSLAMGFFVKPSHAERAKIVIKEHGARHRYKPIFGKKYQ
ncbi:MAG: hypothetical protein QM758_05480 [Armatimonas sp.]